MCAILNHQVCANLCQQPYEPSTLLMKIQVQGHHKIHAVTNYSPVILHCCSGLLLMFK